MCEQNKHTYSVKMSGKQGYSSQHFVINLFCIKIRPLVFLFEWFNTSNFWSPLQLDVRCEPRLRVEDRTLTYNGFFQIVIWMESGLIGTHTTSSYTYIFNCIITPIVQKAMKGYKLLEHSWLARGRVVLIVLLL